MAIIGLTEATITTVPRTARDNEFLDVVKNLTINDRDAKSRAGVSFYVELSGSEAEFGTIKKDDAGNPLPRTSLDTAVINARRDIDAAANALAEPVTVRKSFELVALDSDGKVVTRKNAKPTHAKFAIYATPKQTKSVASAETAGASTETVSGSE